MAIIANVIWKKYIEEQQSSGLIAPEFCKLKNINYKTFANKKSKLKKGLLDLTDKPRKSLISDLTVSKMSKKESPFVKLVPEARRTINIPLKDSKKLIESQILKLKLKNGIEIEFGISELDAVIEAAGGLR